MERKVFCGGVFPFDCRDANYQEQASKDYRTLLLGSVDSLLNPDPAARISKHVTYIGPFYFESPTMVDREVVACELEMISRCTDAVFILDSAACPGTIAELTYANCAKKRVHIFYVVLDSNEETESELHTPCWYPIVQSPMLNPNVELYPCNTYEAAVNSAIDTIKGW